MARRSYRRGGYNGSRYRTSAARPARRTARGSGRRTTRSRATARTRDIKIVIETHPVSSVARPGYNDALTKTVRKGKAKY